MGVEDPSVSVVSRADVKRKTLLVPLEDFSTGQRVRGVVTNIPVTNFGAFVDFGATLDGVPKDGLVHKMRLSDQYVEQVADWVSVGQVVEAFFMNFNRPEAKVGLSMVEGKALSPGGGNRRLPKDMSGFVGVKPEVRLKGIVK